MWAKRAAADPGIISIREELNDAERSRRAFETALQCYRECVASIAASVVTCGEEDHGSDYRASLEALADAVHTVEPEVLPMHTDRIRTELRGYHETVTCYIDKMQAERAAIERALQELTASLSLADDDYDGQIRVSIERLRSIAQSPVGKPSAHLLRVVADSIERGVENIRRQHQSTMAQFHQEIRKLQRRLDPYEAEAALSSLIRFFSREQIEERIANSATGSLRVALLRIRGLRLAGVRHGGSVPVQLAEAVLTRLRNIVSPTAVIGRWSFDIFAVLIPLEGEDVAGSTLCRNIASLNGQYACMEGEATVRPSVEISACVLDGSPAETPPQFMEKLTASASCI
ncbi:MAG: hypothetical protein KGN84_13405 [Acidobacteriota bacterium]|nr:hypothetical protein [Acidobacteriota bacterium]